MWPNFKQQPLFAALAVFVLLGVIAWQVVAIATKMRQYRSIAPAQRQLSVAGVGKIRGVPDVAIVNAGFTVNGSNVRAVQDSANRKMTALIAAVKGAGVAAEDIQTSEFSVNPQYSYEQKEGPRITGYEARQSVEIRIRNLDRINTVLGAAGAAGATNISGLRFTIDDPERLQAEARGRAITNARAKAITIAGQLGVRLGRVVSFGDSSSAPPVPYLMRAEGLGIGGGGAAPTIEQGTNEIISNVTVTYELE